MKVRSSFPNKKSPQWFIAGATCLALEFVSAFLSPFASANSEEIIQSVLGGSPYLVVYEDDNGASKREPGIYIRDPKASWKKAIAGKLLPAPIKGGLSVQLQMAKATSRFEAVAIIDGRVTVFSVGSSNGEAGTYLPIGTSGNEVVDPLDGTPIDIPLIENSEDVTFYDSQLRDGLTGELYQVVLVSMKSKSPLGSGLTFAMVLSAEKNSRGNKIELLYSPILLDWKYSDSHELNTKLLTNFNFSGKHGFFSAALLKRFKQGQPTDLQPVTQWRHIMDRLYHQPQLLMTTLLDRKARVPYINVITGKLELDELPSIKTTIAGQDALAVYDPIHNRAGLVARKESISLQDSLKMKPLISGAVDCTDHCVALATNDPTPISRNGRASLVRMRDGQLYLALTLGNAAIDVLPIKPMAQELNSLVPQRVSWYPVQNTNFILVSWLFEVAGKPQGHTVLLNVTADLHHGRIAGNVLVSREYFNADQLAWRTQQHNNEVFAFDALTPNTEDLAEYQKTHRLTAAHIDLQASIATNDVVEYYPESLSRDTVSNRITYTTYEERPNGKKRSGFYERVPENQKPTPLIVAQFLKPELIKKKHSETWDGRLDTKAIEIEQGMAAPFRVEVSGVAVDPHFQDGNQGTQFYALYTPEDRDQPIGATQLLVSQINPKDLESFVFITADTKPNNGSPIPIVAAINSKVHGTTLVSFRLHRVAGKLALAESVQNFRVGLPDRPLAVKEIMARLRFENGSIPFWIESPEVAEADLSFRLKNLVNGNSIEPNRLREQKNFSIGEISGRSGSAGFGQDSWRFYGYDRETKERITKLKDASEFQTDIFPQLREIFEDLSNPHKEPRHVVLIVPKELKKYADNYPLALRARDHDRPQYWSQSNPDVHLYVLDSTKSDQTTVLKNLEEIREAPHGLTKRRAVLYSPLSTLQAINRPRLTTKTGEPFKISESRIEKINFNAANPEVEDLPKDSLEPHILYLNATEGNTLALSEFDPNKQKLRYSSIFIGTAEEWEKLLADTNNLEGKYGLANHYDVINLAAPTAEFRQQFVIDILQRNELKNLGYKIDAASFVRGKTSDEVSVAEAERIAATYLVNRIEALSKSNNLPVFEGFMKAMNSFATELTNNSRIRAQRTIDRGVIEGLLLKTFIMPININLLPANDPLRILSKPEATFLWQQAGYLGEPELKKKVIQTILSQLIPDQKSISSSFIFFGNTRSGKTFLIETLVKMLGLKEYNFNNPNENENAWSFLLKMPKIYEDGTSPSSGGTGMMSMSDAIAHLEKFLASENGERGFIWFDDMHLAPPKVRAHFISRIRMLLESPVYTVKNKDGKIIERPTRNLTIGITLNPTENQSRIEKFTHDRHKGATDSEVILATLSSGDGSNDLERSFLARFGKLINVGMFPAEAKGPKLLQTTREAASADFTNNQRYVLVNTETVENLVKAFPRENAGDFLSTSSRGLIQSVPGNENNRLFILTPRRSSSNSQEFGDSTTKTHPSSFTISGNNQVSAIEDFIKNNVVALPIETTYRGKIEFTKFILDNIRKKAYETILWSTSKDPSFTGDAVLQRNMSAPLSRAIYHHLQEVPALALDELNIDPLDFGAHNQNEKTQFRRTLGAMTLEQGLTYNSRLPKVGVLPPSGVYSAFIGNAGDQAETDTRQHVLAENISSLEKTLTELVEKLTRVENLHKLPNPDNWLKSLSNEDPDLVKTLGPEFSHQILKYLNDIFRTSLLESSKQTESNVMSQYDAMRLYLLAFDRALSRLPWGSVANFLIRSLQRAADDMSHGQAPGVQYLLFESKSSPLVTIDIGMVLGLAKSMPYFEENGTAVLDRHHTRFMQNCQSLLTSGERK